MISRCLLPLGMLVAAPALFGQQANINNFTVRVTINGSTTTVPTGSNLTFVAEAIGRPVTAQFTVAYRGTGTGTISRLDIAGASEFTTATVPNLPVQMTPGQEATFAVRFTPTSARATSAQLSLTLVDGPAAGGTGGSATGTVTINLTGSVPDLGLAYILQTDNNPVNVPAGGTVPFPPTPVATTLNATIAVINRGSGPLDLRSISLSQSGTDFQLIGLPLLPGLVASNTDVRFTLRYQPRQSGTQTASLTVTTSAQTYTVTVQGTAVGAQFSYEILDGENATPLLPTVQYPLPDTNLGQTRSFVVRVRNNGDADGVISAISILGSGFTVSDLPFLPVTLTPGSTVFFTLNYTPTTPGRVIGRLRIGNDSFELTANGLGSRLEYFVGVAGSELPLAPGGAINFPTTQIGRSSSLSFIVSNTGTNPAVITSIASLSGAEFTLSGVPPLPTTLEAGSRITATITFQPASTGPISSSMRVDNTNFILNGVGGAPPPLPSYRFDGATSPVEPLQQVAVGLSLASGYPIPISGTLNLGFSSDSFSVDPALQFITGGRTINFVIPANATQAIFANNTTQIRLQTGTVAGTIVLTPVFTTSGGYSLTPTVVTSQNLAVPARAPGVLALDWGQPTATSINLLVTGYASSRTLTRMNITFGLQSGAQVQTTQFALDIGTAATLWYRNTTSQNFGSLFTATVPFDIRQLQVGQTIRDFLSSFSVTLTNELGTSPSVSLPIQ
jgi:hypothetical protein